MNNFGLFELFNKFLTSQKDMPNEKNTKKEDIKSSQESPTSPPLPYKNSAIINLLNKHNAISKQIDNDNKKK